MSGWFAPNCVIYCYNERKLIIEGGDVKQVIVGTGVILISMLSFNAIGSMDDEKVDAKYIAEFRGMVCQNGKNPAMCEKGVNILMHLVNARAKMAENCKILKAAGKIEPKECHDAIEVSDYVSGLLK